MKWRIEGTVNNTLYPKEQPIIFSDTVEGDNVEDALNKLDPKLHELAAKRGGDAVITTFIQPIRTPWLTSRMSIDGNKI